MLRKALETDLDSLRAWRNQEANRQVSSHQAVIGPEEHRRWWEGVQQDPTREVLVFCVDNLPCGVVTFFNLRSDSGRRRGSWGFYLDHDGLAQRGSTFVAWPQVMRQAVDHAFDVLGLDVLEAEVLEHNDVVRRANRRLGFREGPVEDREVDGEIRRLLPVELARGDRHDRAGHPTTTHHQEATA